MQWVLSSKEINFPYPLGLTLLHMVFSSVLCFMLTKIFKVSSLVNIMRVATIERSYHLPYFLLYLVFLLQILKVEEGMTAEM
jgi:hypothetical protein